MWNRLALLKNHSIDIKEASTGKEVDNPRYETNTVIEVVYMKIKMAHWIFKRSGIEWDILLKHIVIISSNLINKEFFRILVANKSPMGVKGGPKHIGTKFFHNKF